MDAAARLDSELMMHRRPADRALPALRARLSLDALSSDTAVALADAGAQRYGYAELDILGSPDTALDTLVWTSQELEDRGLGITAWLGPDLAPSWLAARKGNASTLILIETESELTKVASGTGAFSARTDVRVASHVAKETKHTDVWTRLMEKSPRLVWICAADGTAPVAYAHDEAATAWLESPWQRREIEIEVRLVFKARRVQVPDRLTRRAQKAAEIGAPYLERLRGRVERSLQSRGAVLPHPAHAKELAEAAQDIQQRGGIEIPSTKYRPEFCRYAPKHGTVEWQDSLPLLRPSTPLFSAQPPFVVRALFAGHAKAIGFATGLHKQVMCRMARDRHTLVLSVAANGDYVLLRDGEIVAPLEVRGLAHPPPRILGPATVRLAAHSLTSLFTQQVKWWDGTGNADVVERPSDILFSVIVVSTKYARRLQICLSSIARQEGIDRSRIEVLVAHVPGIDATEDVLEATELTWPDLSIVRLRFPPVRATHKGLMINTAMMRARGRRFIVTDADIVFPPGLFAKMESSHPDATFVGVRGRKMLDRTTTARILTGQLDPVAQFDELVNSPGEFRVGEYTGPLGYFQGVKADCFPTVRYREASHFEGADARFTDDLEAAFGPATIMSDVIVLHLDHDGSRWYGTDRHF